MIDLIDKPKRGRPRKDVPPEHLCQSKKDRLAIGRGEGLRNMIKDANRNATNDKPPLEWQAVLHQPVIVQCDEQGLSLLDCGHRVPQLGTTPYRWCSECYRRRMRRIFSWSQISG